MHTSHASGIPQPSQISRPLSQPTFFTHSNLMSPMHVTPGITRSEYTSRRQILSQNLPKNSLSLFPSNPHTFMTEDVPYLYHHNTDLMYITGVTEPGAVLLAERTSNSDVRYILFVADRDPSRELWDGPSCGTDLDVRHYFAVDDLQPTQNLANYLSKASQRIDSFHFDSSINQSISHILHNIEGPHRDMLVSKWKRNIRPKSFLLAQRLIKSDAEVSLLREAAFIMSEALNETMAKCSLSDKSSSITEKKIEALLEFGCKIRGSSRMAFPSVVASGVNSTILHYMNNNSTAYDGDFVMIDAGCEFHGYCSDVSRSWPVSGKFSGPQKDIYQLVLEVQLKCIALAKEGALSEGQPISLDSMHSMAVRELTDGLLQLGFMKGYSLESAITSGIYSRYFPHATGHYLGMDVHDTHHLPKNLDLKEGMVITVEPGLYCQAYDTTAPAAFRGLGMRIEDDVLVGGDMKGTEVLSKDSCKEIVDIEALVGSAL